MPRKSAKQQRFDSLSQRQLRRLEKKKKYADPRRDGTDWTDRMFKKLKEVEENERAED